MPKGQHLLLAVSVIILRIHIINGIASFAVM